MASNESQINKLFCVLLENPITYKRIYMNFISDPGQEISIKLPKFMIDLSVNMFGLSEKRELLDIIFNRKEMIASNMEYLRAMYGDNLPEVYMAPNGRDLVMDIYIYHEHYEALKKLANKRRSKVFFLKYVFATVQQRVLELDSDISTVRTISGPFHKTYQEDLQEKGPRAEKKKIYSCLFVKNISDKLEWMEFDDVEVGDNLFTFGWKDKHLRRSVYFNVVADTKPEAIRWPLVNIGSQEPRLNYEDVLCILDEVDQSGLFRLLHYAQDCLDDYHDKYGLTVHLAENNSDLIFTIPVHIDHAPIMKIHFEEHPIRSLFSTCVYDHCRHLVLTLSNRTNSLEPNCMMERIERPLEPQPKGREATEGEIYSLLLAEKRYQGRKDPMMSLLLENLRPERLWHTESDDDSIS